MTELVGVSEGWFVSIHVVGASDEFPDSVGAFVGALVGAFVGVLVGAFVGAVVGLDVVPLAKSVGPSDGVDEGALDDAKDGESVQLPVGESVQLPVGDNEGGGVVGELVPLTELVGVSEG